MSWGWWMHTAGLPASVRSAATWKPELLAAYPILAAVCGEGDARCHATRDRFPVQSAGHLGPVPGLEGWRLAGERRERRDLQHLQYHDALQAAYGAEILMPHPQSIRD